MKEEIECELNSIISTGEDKHLVEVGFQIEEVPQRALHYISGFSYQAFIGCLAT